VLAVDAVSFRKSVPAVYTWEVKVKNVKLVNVDITCVYCVLCVLCGIQVSL
jgi:hypothetical protein